MKQCKPKPDDLALFALVAEHGSISAASRATSIPKSKLSRRILQLEDDLDARLVERSNRTFVLTGLGERLLAHAREIGRQADIVEEIARSFTKEPSGLVRVSCPLGVDQLLYPILAPLMREFSKLRVNILPQNQPVNLIEDRVDIAMRVRPHVEGEADFRVRPLSRSRSILVAAPNLLEGVNLTELEQLREVPTISRSSRGLWDEWPLVFTATGEQRSWRHEPRFSAGDFEVLLQGILDGLGVGLIPDFLCAEYLANQRLVQILPQWQGAEATAYLLYISRRAQLPAVRVVLDALIAGLSDQIDKKI